MSLFMLVMVMVVPVRALSFEPATFYDQGIEVTAEVSASVPWTSPFSEDVELTLTVRPNRSDVVQVNITEVTLSVNRRVDNTTSFMLVVASTHGLSEPVTGTSQAQYSSSFHLSGTTAAPMCYFGVSVCGTYSNGTHVFEYEVFSNQSLVGPFEISASLATPQVLVGLGISLAFIVVLVVGLLSLKRSRAGPKRRRRLLEE